MNNKTAITRNTSTVPRLCLFFLLLLMLLSFLPATAQKIVFSDEYNLKNISMPTTATVSAGGARLIEDSLTKERLLIFSGKKELIFYMLDPKWKLLHKMTKGFDKETLFKDGEFSILRSVHDQKKWTFIVRTVSGYSKESVDFATESHVVQGRYLQDMAKNYQEELFMDGNNSYILYLDKNDQVNLTSFSSDFTVKNIKLDLSSELPIGKSKKYSTRDLYNFIGSIDSIAARRPFFTRKKVHFYVQPDTYAILVFNDEPVTELSIYDKQSGTRLKRQLFSAETLLPAEAKGKSVNTAALFYDNKVHLLAAYKTGGVYAVFEADSKKNIYNYAYSEKDTKTSFNYGPVTYETLPGALNMGILREKVDDISMDEFCTEMFKHSCAITAEKMPDGNLLIKLANYDQKEIAGATSSLRIGMNTLTSPLWYVSTSAGLIFEAGSLQLSAKKTSWNELNRSSATDKYQKIEPAESSGAEYHGKKAVVLKTQFIGDRRYTIYYYDRQLKIDEKKFNFIPPKIFGVTD